MGGRIPLGLPKHQLIRALVEGKNPARAALVD
jgi:hypothetical protein